jgi:hypothetical protein
MKERTANERPSADPILGLANKYSEKCAAFDAFDFRDVRTPQYSAALVECDAVWSELVQAVAALRASRDELAEAAHAYRDAQDALDNREYAGINAEDHSVLMRRRNAARDDLDTALARAGA